MRDNISKKGGEARIPVPEKRRNTRVGDREVADRGQQATLCRINNRPSHALRCTKL